MKPMDKAPGGSAGGSPTKTTIHWHGGAISTEVGRSDAKPVSDAGDRSLGRNVPPWDKEKAK